jgi:cobalt/nickel transport system ATP-binding protein
MVECKDVSYIYTDGTVALSHMDFSTANGQVIGVVGSNGAGKSTLFKCLTGIIKPTTGHLTYGHQPIKYDKKSLQDLRKKVNIVLQGVEKQIFLPIVKDDIAFGPRNLRMSSDIVERKTLEAIKITALESCKDKLIHNLSYGQKKRVAIAGVLALNPEIIIFDEPEAGLDPYMKQQMVLLIKALSESGKTIIMASHNMDFIYETCDYVYLLKKGNPIADGTPKDILGDYELMVTADMEMPWILKVCHQLNIPPVDSEENLFKMVKGQN